MTKLRREQRKPVQAVKLKKCPRLVTTENMLEDMLTPPQKFNIFN